MDDGNMTKNRQQNTKCSEAISGATSFLHNKRSKLSSVLFRAVDNFGF